MLMAMTEKEWDAANQELEARAKDVERTKAAIAMTLCSLHFTDGFCSPRHNAECRCVKMADACMGAMKSVGVKPVWVFNKDRS